MCASPGRRAEARGVAGKKGRGRGCGRVRKEEAEGVADAWIYKKAGPDKRVRVFS